MMIGIFSETDELFLFGLTIPLDDALVLRAGIDMLGGYLQGRNTKGMPFIFYALTKTIHSVRLRYIFV